jgi:hypothetical protein
MTKLGWRQCRWEAAGFFRVPTMRFRGGRGRVPFSRYFLTDVAWRGSAASLRISATISASIECVRGCIGMPLRSL